MKAYGVRTDAGEVTEIIYADTPAKAKQIAQHGDWYGDVDWNDLLCRRLKEFDDPDRTKMGFAGWGPEIQREARHLGWYEVDGGDACSECGLHEMSEVPESVLDDDGVCYECLMENKEVSL